MEDALITILETFKFPVYRQGSVTGGKYPDDFFTFWNYISGDHSHYDNDDYGTEWQFSIYFYSTNPANTYSYLSAAIDALKAAGWIISGRGYDVSSAETTHTGRGVDVEYLEINTGGQNNA